MKKGKPHRSKPKVIKSKEALKMLGINKKTNKGKTKAGKDIEYIPKRNK